MPKVQFPLADTTGRSKNPNLNTEQLLKAVLTESLEERSGLLPLLVANDGKDCSGLNIQGLAQHGNAHYRLIINLLRTPTEPCDVGRKQPL